MAAPIFNKYIDIFVIELLCSYYIVFDLGGQRSHLPSHVAYQSRDHVIFEKSCIFSSTRTITTNFSNSCDLGWLNCNHLYIHFDNVNNQQPWFGCELRWRDPIYHFMWLVDNFIKWFLKNALSQILQGHKSQL